MGVGVTERGDGAIEATGAGLITPGAGTSSRDSDHSSRDESTWLALSLRVTADRVLIKADREDHAPALTESGVYLASSLAAAVEGDDPADSWFVGTIVQLGPLVNRFELRPLVLRWLHALEDHEYDIALAELRALRQRIEALPTEMPDPLQVGHRVCFSWASGQQIAVGGERYLILRASDVLAVLEDE